MSWDNKVVWSEGMFLRTLHFQQQARYAEKLLNARAEGLRPYGWGLSELQINRELLATGKFAVTACRGVLPDGTPFSIPDDVPHPPPLAVPENTRDCIVYLTLPVRQPGGIEVDAADQEETVARYATSEFEAVDTNAGSETVAPVQVGKLRLRYGLQTDELAGYVTIGVARIVEVRPDKTITLDEKFVPACLDCVVSPVLTGYVNELQGLFRQRGEALAGRASEAGSRGAAEIADFLMLLLVNRYEPLMVHYGAVDNLHPETFYATAVQMAGELATFTSKSRRPDTFAEYRHDDLQATFTPVMASIRQSLSQVLEQTAIAIPLQARKYGIRVGVIADRSLLANATFVLAVRAEMKTETVRRSFPNQVKIGPVEQIRELVNVALPGIAVRPLPVAPRQIPYHAGVTYFELDRSSKYWKGLSSSGGLAIHLAGDFSAVEMECWAIRDASR
ncbi:MAG: type VI secretion system baseplate subunit TssK [Inquilinus sp.]|nr:type VI secretion system baseplate subunit TssK [Inquilinus sp.]